MTEQQTTEYLAALFTSVTIGVILPAVMLLAMIVMFIWVLHKAQQREDFDASDFLRDDNGKLSAMRLFAFVCLCVHSWVIAVETMSGRITDYQVLIYAATWSGSLVLITLINKLSFNIGPAK
jgi:hypothetical protein